MGSVASVLRLSGKAKDVSATLCIALAPASNRLGGQFERAVFHQVPVDPMPGLAGDRLARDRITAWGVGRPCVRLVAPAILGGASFSVSQTLDLACRPAARLVLLMSPAQFCVEHLFGLPFGSLPKAATVQAMLLPRPTKRSTQLPLRPKATQPVPELTWQVPPRSAHLLKPLG